MAKFDPATDIPDLAGKTVIVTGGNAGLGAETVKAIAAHNPDNLFLCARTPSKAEAFITELRKQHPKTSTKPITLDLASFDSIRAAAKQISDSCDKIDVLILNAGVSALAAGTTKEGYEIQIGTNHVGHAFFTQLLMPKVLAASKQPGGDARIVVVSSKASQSAKLAKGVPIDEMKTDMTSVPTLTRYGFSKLANAHFAQGLAREYPNVIVTAPHPGVVATEIWGKVTGYPGIVRMPLAFIAKTFALTPYEGAMNQLWCGFGKGVKSGKYYEPVGKEIKTTPATYDEKLRDSLWEWTNKELASHGGPGWATA